MSIALKGRSSSRALRKESTALTLAEENLIRQISSLAWGTEYVHGGAISDMLGEGPAASSTPQTPGERKIITKWGVHFYCTAAPKQAHRRSPYLTGLLVQRKTFFWTSATSSTPIQERCASRKKREQFGSLFTMITPFYDYKQHCLSSLMPLKRTISSNWSSVACQPL